MRSGGDTGAGQPVPRRHGITRLADVTGLDVIGIPVVQCVRPNSRSVSVSQGKGVDIASAATSAIMESIESYHAERVELPLIYGSWAELRHRHRLVNVQRLPRPSASQFHAHAPLLWVPGRNLLDGEVTLVPFDTVNGDYRLPYPSGAGSFVMSSNGLASGNHPDEAIAHALCELIERDALSLAAVDGVRRVVRPESVSDPNCLWLLERFAAVDVTVRILEVTSDLGIPAFDVTISDPGESRFVPGYAAGGAGCHPDPAVALCRALTEAAQSRLTVICGSRDDISPDDYSQWSSRPSRPQIEANVHGDVSEVRVAFSDLADCSANSLELDVGRIVERLAANDMDEAIVVDLSRREFKIPVVKVIVPGLECAGSLEDTTFGRRARLHSSATERRRDSMDADLRTDSLPADSVSAA